MLSACAELLETARELLEPFVHALHCVLREVFDAFPEHAFSFARETLDGEIELAPEPLCGLLARCPKRDLELLRSRFRMPRGFARHGAAKLLDLAVLHVS